MARSRCYSRATDASPPAAAAAWLLRPWVAHQAADGGSGLGLRGVCVWVCGGDHQLQLHWVGEDHGRVVGWGVVAASAIRAASKGRGRASRGWRVVRGWLAGGRRRSRAAASTLAFSVGPSDAKRQSSAVHPTLAAASRELWRVGSTRGNQNAKVQRCTPAWLPRRANFGALVRPLGTRTPKFVSPPGSRGAARRTPAVRAGGSGWCLRDRDLDALVLVTLFDFAIACRVALVGGNVRLSD